MKTEECAFKILNPNGNGTIQGMEILNKCYSHHKSSEEIADSYTTLLLELTEYGKCLLIITHKI